ncbi:helix-turn-helix domain-containing protein [Patescibacteria group bacterium]|nr:helix-turn-helix domain-containing protein [Patescibacteria group bacterium]
MPLHHIKIPSKKRYLTIKEVAKMFGVTTLTLRNWDKKGKLKALRNPINNYRIYKPEDIELFLRKIESKGKIHLG